MFKESSISAPGAVPFSELADEITHVVWRLPGRRTRNRFVTGTLAVLSLLGVFTAARTARRATAEFAAASRPAPAFRLTDYAPPPPPSPPEPIVLEITIKKPSEEFRARAATKAVHVAPIKRFIQETLKVVGNELGILTLYSGFRSQPEQDGLRCYGDSGARVEGPVTRENCPLDPDRPDIARDSWHKRGLAVDIKTDGMTIMEKAKLVDRFISFDAKGIGIYPTHIHFDWRAAAYCNTDRAGHIVSTWEKIPRPIAQIMEAHEFRNGSKKVNPEPQFEKVFPALVQTAAM